MGLFVVGRLAARHGIKVRLQPAATGGLTALVWLPDHVVVLPEAGASVGFVPAEPEALTEAEALAEPGVLARPGALTGSASPAPVPEDVQAFQPPVSWRLRALAPSHACSWPETAPHRTQPSEAGGLPVPERPARAGDDAGASGPEADPAEDSPDGRRLPIYEAVESDWFSRRRQPSGAAVAAAYGFRTPADTRWAVAKTVLAPTSSGLTTAGLPLRAPRANLLPGAIGSPQSDPSGPARSADAARDRLAGFQRGASRGRAASGHDGQDPAP
jgi:hypothetical protein